MIKQLSAFIGEYKKDVLLSPTFVILEVIMEVLIPYAMAYLIDFGIEPGDMNVIIKLGACLVVAALLSLLFGALAGCYAASGSAGYAKNLRKGLYYKIQDYSFYNIDKFSTGSLITRLTTDITNVQMAFMMIIRLGVRCPVMLVFALIMSFSISARLSLIFLLILPVLAGGLYLIIRKAHPIFESVFRTYDKLNNVVQENLRGIRVVKSFVREDYEKEKFRSISQRIYEQFSKAEKLLAFNGPLMQLCIYSAILLISWFGAVHIVAGNLTTGQLVSLISYAMQVLMSLMMLSLVFVMITISQASAERICEALNETPDITNPAEPQYTVANGDIDFENVGFSYAKDAGKLCLSHIDLHIRSGQTVGVIGGTGSSKSTLVQLIPRFYDVTQGAVKVGGVDVRDYDLQALRQQVAMVLQKNILFSGTVKDNLRWGDAGAGEEEMKEACVMAQADGFVGEFPGGYDYQIEQGGNNVSGGQRQRLCIARALLKKPKILILDDSTSAVDTKTEALIRQAFQSNLAGVTKIIIAQRVSSIMDADQIIVLDHGEINAIGNHQELLANNAIYQEVYYSQTKGGDDHAA
ncbi:MAG: ABC transporter ATP-binding protein/permease [Firmicutes bacterium]|nr:ABC transporter ATP-binding protein/permease [Bacillota bacterium]